MKVGAIDEIDLDRDDRIQQHATHPLARVLEIFGAGNIWIVLAAWLGAITLSAGIGLISMAGHLLSRSAIIESTAVLGLSIVGVRFFAVTRAVGRYLERYVGHLGTFRILTRVRVWFFERIEPGAPAVLATRRRGDVLTRIIDDVATLQDFALRVVVPPIVFVMTAAIGCIVVGWLNPWLALVLIVFLALGGIVLPLIARRTGRAAAEAVVAGTAVLNASSVESVNALADLVAYGREDLLIGRLDEAGARRQLAQRRLADARGWAIGVAGALGALAAVSAVAIAVVAVSDRRLEPVLLAVVPLAVLATYEAVGPLASSYEHLDRSLAASKRLFDLTDAAVTVVEDPPDAVDLPTGPIDIEFEDVTFSYGPDERPALDRASFTIPANTTVAVTGPSGAGKSSIASLLQRFWQADSGTITLGGVDITAVPASRTRAAVVVVEQHDHLFDTTVRDNLLLGDGEADDHRLIDACRAVALDEAIEGWPQGLQTRTGENGRRLSGGERQRLMIARALLAESEVLILDEATAHLDGATRERVLAGIAGWRDGRTTIHIVHELDAAGAVDMVLAVRDGAVEARR